jgi:hypothetical protein
VGWITVRLETCVLDLCSYLFVHLHDFCSFLLSTFHSN